MFLLDHPVHSLMAHCLRAQSAPTEAGGKAPALISVCRSLSLLAMKTFFVSQTRSN